MANIRSYRQVMTPGRVAGHIHQARREGVQTAPVWRTPWPARWHVGIHTTAPCPGRWQSVDRRALEPPFGRERSPKMGEALLLLLQRLVEGPKKVRVAGRGRPEKGFDLTNLDLSRRQLQIDGVHAASL